MAATLSNEALLAILEAHPGLRDRVLSIAMTVVDTEGNLRRPTRPKSGLSRNSWELGRAAMQGWSENQVAATEIEIRQQPGMHRQGKNSTGIRADPVDRGQ